MKIMSTKPRVFEVLSLLLVSYFRLRWPVQVACTMSTRRFSEVRRRTGPEPADHADDVDEEGGADLGDDRRNG